MNARIPDAVEAAVRPSAALNESALEGRIRNALTVDVEDYFQVSAFAPYVERSSWDRLPCRVERNVDRILMLLEAADAHATFFTLGWVAQRYPALVRRIAASGHEVEPWLRAPAGHRTEAEGIPGDMAPTEGLQPGCTAA